MHNMVQPYMIIYVIMLYIIDSCQLTEDKMLVVYSELYTKKRLSLHFLFHESDGALSLYPRLWTMYELGTFLPKRGPKRLVVLPTFLIRCTIVAVPMLILHGVWVQLLLLDSVAALVQEIARNETDASCAGNPLKHVCI